MSLDIGLGIFLAVVVVLGILFFWYFANKNE